MSFINKNKLIIIIGGILLIGIIIFLLVNHFNKTDLMNDLNVSYSGSKNISFRDFSKDLLMLKL